MKRIFALAAMSLLLSADLAKAQSFFADFAADPATGVDKGSTSRLRKVEENTGYLTFTSNGAEELGPYNAAVGMSLPDFAAAGDQFDAVLFISGLSENDEIELAALGLGYRLQVPDTGVTLFASADHGEYRLGSSEGLALDIRGEQTNFAIGARRLAASENSRVLASLEFALRDSSAEALGRTVVEEDLRLVRAALQRDTGQLFRFRTRLAISATKGLGGFGASAENSLLGSAPGSTANFLRIAFSAEASVPVSRRVLVNAGIVGQWTEDSLPISQRCGYGTNTYARGFDQSFVNGDRCLGSRVELAYNFKLPSLEAKRLDLRQGFFGIDGGWTEDLGNAVLTGNTDNWSSASIGYRTAIGDYLGELSVTHILDEPVGAIEQDATRVWFRLALRF
ncbi:ShlB/FhaC/HecB family hemolysin secretion/activation protein [Roseobacter sp. OBYS 0001]|uniref:ShlB/FhaC/HecB family hemolysin secretion/activation protein n=1 Tax=Roseobacter sp. OBYS 0001 TaxID=882651 RepID=UPI001C7E69C3|nr:ShlB/FhaC/HecB family hemolysin secretion/activation protein [Roseobacter sp. OBYS 0001]